MRYLLIIFSLLLFSLPSFAAFDSAQFNQQKDLKILRVTPEGNHVLQRRQIVILFNRPVVPIGNMERSTSEIPVTIQPELKCQWRWLNTSSLSCNLDEKNEMKLATNYQVVINPGIKAEDGQTIKEAYHHKFTTEIPDIQYANVVNWKSPFNPVINIEFNQPVTASSAESSIKIISQKNNDSYQIKVSANPQDKKPPQKVGKEEARENWIAISKKELPQDQSFFINLEAGLVSAFGLEKGVAKSQISDIQTFPEFNFIGIRCYTNDDKQIFITQNQKTQDLCSPMNGVEVVFSSPVLKSQFKKFIKIQPDIFDDSKDDDREYSTLNQARYKDQTYSIFLPNVKAATTYHLTSKEINLNVFRKVWFFIKSVFNRTKNITLSDEFGRNLSKPIDISFSTGDKKPDLQINYRSAVLESGVDSDVPIYVTNLNKTTFNYSLISSLGVKNNLSFTTETPTIRNAQFAIPLKIRDMLGGKSGAIYGKLTSDPAISRLNENYLFAQVTPFYLHLKLGYFNSIAWVTQLATGKLVAGATITLYQEKSNRFTENPQPLSKAITDQNGIAILDGMEKLNPNFTEGKIFAKVNKGKDMALMPIDYEFSTDSNHFFNRRIYGGYDRQNNGHMKAWGTTSQGIYRAGDVIEYKIYVRSQNNQTLTAAPKAQYNLEIIDPVGNKAEEIKGISLNNFGAFSGKFETSKQGAVGWYQFHLTKQNNQSNKIPKRTYEIIEENSDEWFVIKVLVSDFTPSSFKVNNQVNGDLFGAKQNVEILTNAKLHSGGSYNDAKVRITATLESKGFTSTNLLFKDFIFGSNNDEQNQIFQKINLLDNKGENSISFNIPEQNIYYGRLTFESAVQDDRGKYVAAYSYANYAGVNRFVGLKTNEWIFTSGKPAIINYAVADERGNPASDTKVNITIERNETKIGKVNSAENGYLPEFVNDWVSVSKCSGTSTNAVNTCKFTPKKSGHYRAIANIKDTKGKEHITQINMYVSGSDYNLWNESNNNSLEIVPEKPSYKVGEMARYLVKNPYPEAKALITIERYGVIDHFVQTLNGSAPVIEFKVKPDYIPGFYLSVTVFSPRINKPVENQIDLGKPAFKIGYVTVPVKDSYKEILVTAKTNREIYKPRQKVKLTLHAKPRFKDKNEPIELAVAVLDESVFDLLTSGKEYFDPYQGFYNLDNLDLRNYNLLTRLISRQKFAEESEKEGITLAKNSRSAMAMSDMMLSKDSSYTADGSDIITRDIFKFVSYWNPSIKTDANGNATIEFDAPDNLTGWRVLALAVTPSDRMGLGDANFKVNRSTEIRSLLPNQVIEGDNFEAGFSVNNRTDKKRKLAVKINISGDFDNKTTGANIEKQISLEPYQRTVVKFNVQTKPVKETRENQAGQITFLATAKDNIDSDAIKQSLIVNKRRELENAANYGTTTENKIEESVKFPSKIYNDIGNLSVTLSPTVIGNIEGAFTYLRDYPYMCWEQKLTKAVMASHYFNLRSYISKNFEWIGAKNLPNETLKEAVSFQAPNGGMAYFKPQDQYADPYLSAYTALEFNWLKKSGYQIPTAVESKLNQYLKNFLNQDSYPEFYSKNMAMSVKAVALAALSENGKITLSDLKRYQPFVAQMSLFGKAYFLQAAMNVQGSESLINETTNLILASSNQSGGKFNFNSDSEDYSRILSSGMRDNCVILSTFTKLGERTLGKDLVADIPYKLVRSITEGRGSKTHWENTQENLFCMNGLLDYSRVYENAKPKMSIVVNANNQKLGTKIFADVKNQPVTFSRNIIANDIDKNIKVIINKTGSGRFYYTTRLSYSPLAESSNYTNSGIEVRREYSVQRNGKWELLKSPFKIKQSEVVRVDIFLSLPAPRNFVVVNDPIPGGLEPINRDLATTSIVDANKANITMPDGSWFSKYSNWISYGESFQSFYHKELRNDSVRFYSDYLSAGNYHLAYTAQAIAAGNFLVIPTHAEEMYDPDVYGKGINERLVISE